MNELDIYKPLHIGLTQPISQHFTMLTDHTVWAVHLGRTEAECIHKPELHASFPISFTSHLFITRSYSASVVFYLLLTVSQHQYLKHLR